MDKFISRKFILTILFALVVCGNAWAFGKALDWQSIAAIGTVFGVYTAGNVVQKQAGVADIIDAIAG